MEVFSNSLAKRPGQYGSIVTFAAFTSVEMLSACMPDADRALGTGWRADAERAPECEVVLTLVQACNQAASATSVCVALEN